MRWHAIAIASVLVVATQASAAEKKYGPGASDTEIKLGQTSPFSRVGLQRDRQDAGRLFQNDQRAGWRERAQDQPDHAR